MSAPTACYLPFGAALRYESSSGASSGCSPASSNSSFSMRCRAESAVNTSANTSDSTIAYRPERRRRHRNRSPTRRHDSPQRHRGPAARKRITRRRSTGRDIGLEALGMGSSRRGRRDFESREIAITIPRRYSAAHRLADRALQRRLMESSELPDHIYDDIHPIATTTTTTFLPTATSSPRRASPDECYGTGSDEGRTHDIENHNDSDQTDFMNATDKIYENLRQSRPQPPSAPLTRLDTLPPPPQLHVMIDDESSIYGRLTALLLTNARKDQQSQMKVNQVQLEIVYLFGISFSIDLTMDNEQNYLRNCAIFGNQVAAQLRLTRQQRSTADFETQVKRLHKILYRLKKKNAFLNGVGRFVQKFFKSL